ncbi:MAG: prephenate dehydrogenase/arogenate dehydrogenase family protein [Thermoflexales bacterium]|nr:prephenate dehydrogenase/arogenate dehydrogenase family protein [Thermoflexales bacterium]
MKHLINLHITIVGLGLMGGSLGGALRGQCQAVAGVSRKAETIEAARARGLIDWGTTELAEGVRQADMVILAGPVRVIARQVTEIGPLLKESCVVFDLGSTKQHITGQMETLPPYVQVIGGHPMCGKETSGVQAADPGLYRGRSFILCPGLRTSTSTLELAMELVEAVGATPLIIEPERQDFLVATLSHLPYMLACALVSTADATTSPDPMAWKIVAGGFRDTSRVSASDVTMMLDILMTNKANIRNAVNTCITHLQSLARLVEAGDEEALRAALTKIRATRLEMFP